MPLSLPIVLMHHLARSVLRFDDVVPLAMKEFAHDIEGLELGVGDDDACRIRLAVLDGCDL